MTNPTTPPHRARSRRWIIATSLVVAVLAIAFVLTARPHHHRPPPPAVAATPTDSFAPTEAQWAGLHVAPVRRFSFHHSERTDGLIAANDDLTTAVYSPVSGVVTRVMAEPGQHVDQGAPLFVVAASEFVQAQNDLTAALAALATARAQLQLTTVAEKRAHDLYLAQGGALKDWQQAQADLAGAQASVASAGVALGAVRNRLRILGRSPEQIAAMQGAPPGTSFDAQIVVPAPISGTILTRALGPGQNIISAATGGTTALFTIADLSRIWLVANLREEDAALVHPGDRVAVRALAYPGRVFDATINYIAPAMDPSLRRLPVRAEIANPDGALKPQMFASFTIIGADAGDHLAVPEQAVVYEGQSAHVWRADPASHLLALRPITYGILQDGMLEVLGGLAETDQVVTSGAVFIDRAADPN